jgi:hypothetical protein
LKAGPGTSAGRDKTRKAPPAVTRNPRNSIVKWSGTAMKLCNMGYQCDTEAPLQAEDVRVYAGELRRLLVALQIVDGVLEAPD